MREREGPAPPAWEGEGLPSSQLAQNSLNHSIRVRQRVIVPKSQYPPALAFEPHGAAEISLVVGVLAAIRLDHEVMSGAGEIDDEVADRILPAKPVTAQSAVPKRGPETPLRIRGISPQSARVFVGH